MALMRQPTPLGRLFRKHREAHNVSWARLRASVGMSDEAMQKWERGDTKDPALTKALLFAEEVGIPLRDLAETVLGRPYRVNGERSSPSGETPPARLLESGDLAAARDAERGGRRQRRRRKPPSRSQDE